MKKMIAGIFLVFLSIWATLYAGYSGRNAFEYLALILPLAAVLIFIWGFLESKD